MSGRVVYRNKHFAVRQVSVQRGDRNKEFYVGDFGARAGLLAVRADEVLLVRQRRLLIDGLSWEVPGGAVDAAEDPEQAAVRECLEETGVLCANLKPLVSFIPGLDTLNNPTHLYYSREPTDTGTGPRHRDEAEECAWVPLDKSVAMIASKEIVDSLSIIALLAYQTWCRDG